MLERDMTRVECLRFEKNRSRPSVLGITRASNRFERHGKQHHPLLVATINEYLPRLAFILSS